MGEDSSSSMLIIIDVVDMASFSNIMHKLRDYTVIKLLPVIDFVGNVLNICVLGIKKFQAV